MIEGDAQLCERFEQLLEKDDITDEEFAFCVAHQRSCSLGIHTDEALERIHGLPPGSLARWDGTGSPPSPVPGKAEQHAQKLIDALRREEKD